MLPKLRPLVSELRELGVLHSVHGLLSWDQETYMPEGAIESRSDQEALIAKLSHQRHTSKTFEQALKRAESANDLSHSERRLVAEARKDWEKATQLPEAFVETFARATSKAQHVWQEARRQNNFDLFRPHLEEVIALSKQKAAFWGFSQNPYDGLLDEFEPGMTAAQLKPIFSRLRDAIRQLMKSLPSLPKRGIKGEFPTDKQWDFNIEILKRMGFDFTRGRLDKSTHPFTLDLHPTDVRITTRFKLHDVMEGVSGTMHEGGHALYEQGLDLQWFGTPLGQPISLGIHESQSRLWENHVGKSNAFWRGHFPLLQTYFPDQLKAVSFDDFYREINRVEPSLIRVEADEVTYNLHILIRFEIELELFEGRLSVADLPQFWNEKYQNYLGITPPSNAQGVLQDVHWSTGAFGYFPTYTLGNLYAAQIFDRMQKEIPDLDGKMERGDLMVLRDWLNKNIHGVGRSKTASELIQDVTGYALDEKPFVTYLKGKYILS